MSSTAVVTNWTSKRAPAECGDLRVRRTDINFENRRPGLVDIRIVVTNISSEYTEPTHADISAAPLGAFVPWRALTTVPVPGLAPSESYVIRTQARQRRCQPLGTPDRVPPRQLLVALGADDDNQPPPTSTFPQKLMSLLGIPGSAAPRTDEDIAPGQLPADPLTLVGRGSPHWAGNLNIFIGGRPVERHMAKSLRVYPGRSNLAMFIVGSGRDAYSFDLKGDAAAWQAALFDSTPSRSLLPGNRGMVVLLRRRVELSGPALMILALHPPATCAQGAVEVHVKQYSTGQTAIVEFSLDPQAAGPGCYAV
jgi:hypothetical protein